MDKNNEAIRLVNYKRARNLVSEWEKNHPTNEDEQSHSIKFKGKIPHKSRTILPPSVRKRLAALLLAGGLSVLSLGAYTIYKGITTPPPDAHNTIISTSEDTYQKLQELNKEFEGLSKDDTDGIKEFAEKLYVLNTNDIKSAIISAYNSASPSQSADYVTFSREDSMTGDPSQRRYYANINDDNIIIDRGTGTVAEAIDAMIALKPTLTSDYTNNYNSVQYALKVFNDRVDDKNYIISYDTNHNIMKDYSYVPQKDTPQTAKLNSDQDREDR